MIFSEHEVEKLKQKGHLYNTHSQIQDYTRHKFPLRFHLLNIGHDQTHIFITIIDEYTGAKQKIMSPSDKESILKTLVPIFTTLTYEVQDEQSQPTNTNNVRLTVSEAHSIVRNGALESR